MTIVGLHIHDKHWAKQASQQMMWPIKIEFSLPSVSIYPVGLILLGGQLAVLDQKQCPPYTACRDLYVFFLKWMLNFNFSISIGFERKMKYWITWNFYFVTICNKIINACQEHKQIEAENVMQSKHMRISAIISMYVIHIAHGIELRKSENCYYGH